MDAFGAASAAELLKTAVPSLAKLLGVYAFARLGSEGAAKSGSGSGSNSITRSEHAEIRASEGRNVNTAISDVNRSTPSRVYIQDDGRYVIRGSNGRVHIIEPNGEIVTTMNNVTNFDYRVQSGRYTPLTETEKYEFAQKFSQYLNESWSDYLR